MSSLFSHTISFHSVKPLFAFMYSTSPFAYFRSVFLSFHHLHFLSSAFRLTSFPFFCHLAPFPISLLVLHVSLQWLSGSTASQILLPPSLWFPHLLSFPGSFLLSPAVGGAAEGSWALIGRTGRRLLWHCDAVQMLSSSGSRERQPGGILSLSLSLSLSSLSSLLSPALSLFLSLHAQARIHTRALRHTAAEGRGHTVKASPPLSLLWSLLWKATCLSLLRYPLFPSRTTHPGSAWKRTYGSATIYGSLTHLHPLFFPLHFLLPGSVGWASGRALEHVCVWQGAFLRLTELWFIHPVSSSLFPVASSSLAARLPPDTAGPYPRMPCGRPLC